MPTFKNISVVGIELRNVSVSTSEDRKIKHGFMRFATDCVVFLFTENTASRLFIHYFVVAIKAKEVKMIKYRLMFPSTVTGDASGFTVALTFPVPFDHTLCGMRSLYCSPLIIFTTGSLDSLHSSSLLQNNPFRAECHSAHKAGITSKNLTQPTNRRTEEPSVHQLPLTRALLSADRLTARTWKGSMKL